MQLKNEIEYSIYSCVSVLQLTKKKPGIFSAEGYIFKILPVILQLAILVSLQSERWRKSVCYSSH